MLCKAKTGITGFDEITFGGLPKGRASLVCGNAGCGKTFFAMQFLMNGALLFNEPGVFVSFEEKIEELKDNFSGFKEKLDKLKNKLIIDQIYIERSQILESGEYDLEGLFVRIDYLCKTVGAKRVVLDTIEALFSGFSNPALLRAELRRLLRWFKDRGLTVVITGERAAGSLTRHNLEEFVADCVVVLDQQVQNCIATRRLRILKYRGSYHGTNEYPFLIEQEGFSVLPVTSLQLQHQVFNQRLSSGLTALDEMLGGKGYFRGSTVLISGGPGSGKTSLVSHFIHACCQKKRRCLFFSFEESRPQLVRNIRSIGLTLDKFIDKDLLRVDCLRPSLCGLEMHLAYLMREIELFRPQVVAIDPISEFFCIGGALEIKSMLTRLVDLLKSKGITSLFTQLTNMNNPFAENESSISSLSDTWIVMENKLKPAGRCRSLSIAKSRGMRHSDEVMAITITNEGLVLHQPEQNGVRI